MLAACLAYVMLGSPSQAGAIPVQLLQQGGEWKLMREGKPYFIRGAGGDHSLADLKAAGGNSTRTWDAENIDKMLDEAHRLGMTVTVGFWLGHKEHGFDYNNPDQVKKQYEMVRAQCTKYRNHPAVLAWALGNEMEMNHDVPEVWRAVEDLAKLVKSLDKNHPVLTVIAEIPGKKAENIKKLAPSVDFIGINSYGGLMTLPERLKQAGWTKPYIVTEFGPLGPWESPRTNWGAAIEATSSEKAKFYDGNYTHSIKNQPAWCLGSYAFLWGNKQETTPTWFGMILPSGEQLETVDVISKGWTGQWPTNRAPQVLSFSFSAARIRVAPKELAEATITAKDPNGDAIDYRWELRKEVSQERITGEGEVRPKPLPGYFEGQRSSTVRFTLPKEPGAYRLYVYAFDGKGKAATANEPFFIRN